MTREQINFYGAAALVLATFVAVVVLAPVWLIVDLGLQAAGRNGFVHEELDGSLSLTFTDWSFRKKL